jgi:spermidine/putrescine transport system permease protein
MVQKLYLAFIYLFLYLPILVLILYSVNKSHYSMRWHGFSLRWYAELFHDDGLWIAFFHSIILGLSASFIATALGFFACIRIFLNRPPHQKTFHSLLLLLVVIPDLVFGVALLVFFNVTGISLGFTSLLIAHISFCIPFVIFSLTSRIHLLDRNLYFSALDLGASHFRAFTRILLPLLWPSILSALLLSFTLSFDDVIISYFIAGPDYDILPLTIYSLVRAGVTPELNALCTITILLSMVIVVISQKLSRHKS